MPNDITRIDVAEFRELGYLQELNRRLLHPLGLALEVVVEEDGTERLGGVWDYRGESMRFAELDDAAGAKAELVDELLEVGLRSRRADVGYGYQPAPGARDLDADRLAADRALADRDAFDDTPPAPTDALANILVRLFDDSEGDPYLHVEGTNLIITGEGRMPLAQPELDALAQYIDLTP